MDKSIFNLFKAMCALIFFANSSQDAMAHDLFSTQSKEGIGEVIYLNINHGCDGNPIIAQSLIFPTLNPIVKGIDDNGNEVPVPADLTEILENSSLEGLSALIQERNVFREQDNKTNELGNAIGFYGKKGRLKASLIGRVAFQFSAPFFLPNTCVKALDIQTAIVDICSTSTPALQPGKISLFIPDNGSKIAADARANGVNHGIGEPSTLTVMRNLKTNPYRDDNGKLTKACGNGITVRVTPSAEDVDKNLPIPDYWPVKRKGTDRD